MAIVALTNVGETSIPNPEVKRPDSGEFTRVLLTEKPRDKSMVEQFAEIGEKIIQDSSQGLQKMIHPMVIAAEDKWRLDIHAGIIAAQRLMGKAKYRKVVNT